MQFLLDEVMGEVYMMGDGFLGYIKGFRYFFVCQVIDLMENKDILSFWGQPFNDPS